MDINWWSSSDQFLGTIVRTAVVYVVVVVAVRVAGRRTLARMSAFDTVVTVGLGTMTASTMMPTNATIADFVAGLLTFLVMQVLLAWLRQRSAVVRRWSDFRTEVIVREGQPHLRKAPWTAQLTLSELESRLRQQGVGAVDRTTIVLLEPTGEVTVTTAAPPPPLFAQPRP